MLSRRGQHFTSNAITDRTVYLNRREWMAGAAALALMPGESEASAPQGPALKATRNEAQSLQETPTKFEATTTYNNFYEFGVNKEDPARLAGTLKPRPWAVQVDGLVHKPKTYDIEDLLRLAPLEERVYSLRCVEGWSMVLPWIGYPLAALLRRVEPTGKARYVEFTTLLDPSQFPAQRPSFFGFSLEWPYVEGLRLDEALHPLTLLTVGMYGQVLPNQNGAPVRVVEPKTAWNRAAPQEYGFYSNVNPAVSHPRWSQATERRIGEFRRRPTLPFNGYGDHVASLYAGMDLKKHY